MNQVIWSDLAYLSYTDISNYLTSNFSLDLALKFDEQVEKLCDNLTKFKNFCPAYTLRPTLRKCIVNKHIALLYRIDENKIHLITFYDNRGIHHF